MVFSARRVASTARRIRVSVIKTTTAAQSGHPGGSLGLADVFAVLYSGCVLNFKADDPSWSKRDYFILSNGHVCPAWYAALAEAGCIPKGELFSLREFGSRLQGHPHKGFLPFVESSTGSLGQGVGVAVGLALGLKRSGRANRVFCSLGDGELEEGSCWEAFMAASHHALDNLVFFVDRNGLQQNGSTEELVGLEPLRKKLGAFGLSVIVADGNDVVAVKNAFGAALKQAPCCILFNTVMGKGVSFMQGDHQWHGKPLPSDKALLALRELHG